MGIVADACVDIELVHVAKADEMYPNVSNMLDGFTETESGFRPITT